MGIPPRGLGIQVRLVQPFISTAARKSVFILGSSYRYARSKNWTITVGRGTRYEVNGDLWQVWPFAGSCSVRSCQLGCALNRRAWKLVTGVRVRVGGGSSGGW